MRSNLVRKRKKIAFLAALIIARALPRLENLATLITSLYQAPCSCLLLVVGYANVRTNHEQPGEVRHQYGIQGIGDLARDKSRQHEYRLYDKP